MTAIISESLPARGPAACGRARERRAIRDLLSGAQRGAGGVVLLDGEPGIGKSQLLGEAVDDAAEHGFSRITGTAERLGRAIPLVALGAAQDEPMAGLGAAPDPDQLDATAWWITQIRARLERRAASAPVLVSLDDLHWASPATLAALRRCRVT